ncbi:MAG: LytTR family DNA-binding domain-containing protein [Flavitalea sp.]
MLNAVIIDDEEHCLKTLAWTLEQYCSKEVKLIGQFNDAELAIPGLSILQPDLLFLDIEMPRLNGIQMLEQCKDINFEVIFTTAYDQYAIKAIRLNAMDYLLKPIDKDELMAAVAKVKTKKLPVSRQQISHLQEVHKSKLLNKIALSTMAGLQFVNLDDVIRIEGESNYCNFYIKDKKKILLSKKLGDAEDLLKDNENFFRAHKSHIINLKYVEKYIRGEGGEIIMNDGTSISLSRGKKEEFLHLFSRI